MGKGAPGLVLGACVSDGGPQRHSLYCACNENWILLQRVFNKCYEGIRVKLLAFRIAI